MKQITLEELLSAGCHFGHQVNRSNPKANPFIFESRANVHIIDLEQTHKGLIEAAEFVKSLALEGKTMVIVGTKRQAKQVVEEQIERARVATPDSIFYVTSRWVGGILTNFPEVSKNFKKLTDLENLVITEKSREYTKRELALFDRKIAKLKNFYQGIRELKNAPDALFIIDTHFEKTAVNEAIRVKIKTAGIVDTNGDPSSVTYAIPANDDAVGSIELITSYIVDAWIEGAKQLKVQNEKLKVEEEKVVRQASTQRGEQAQDATAEIKKTKEKEEAKKADSV